MSTSNIIGYCCNTCAVYTEYCDDSVYEGEPCIAARVQIALNEISRKYDDLTINLDTVNDFAPECMLCGNEVCADAHEITGWN